MNRKMQFRAWDKINKKMIYYSPFTLLVDTIEGNPYWKNNYTNFFTNYVHMQATGLQMKEGDEIYEGDIFEYRYEGDIPKRGVVEFEVSCGCYYVKAETLANLLHAYHVGVLKELKLVGDQFENPELLNK